MYSVAKLNPIALAIPVFFLFIGIELLIARRKKLPLYRFADSISALSAGITNQLMAVSWGAVLIAFYAYCYEQHRLLTLPPWAAWTIAVVGVDFLYYWWHRASHEVNFFWAAHVVHHSSEDYNLAVALRQSGFTSTTLWPFYLVLAFVGVPTIVFGIVSAISLLYQFWIHTELLGPSRFDRWINTPSVHRVHHAINPRYLDKNYAATFMIWDRLFGTFEPEIERPVYGISVPLKSFNPLWTQVHYYAELFHTAVRAPSVTDAIRVFYRSPAWHPPWTEPKQSCFRPEGIDKHDVALTARTKGYVFFQFALVVGLVFSILMWGSELTSVMTAILCVFAFVSLLALSGIIERKKWAVGLEASRIGFAIAFGAFLLH